MFSFLKNLFFSFVSFSILTTCYILLATSPAHAEGEFRSDVAVSYKVQETGVTEVTHKITLTNLFSNLYATRYTLRLENINPVSAKATENSTNLVLNQKKEGNATNLEVVFANPVVGKDKSRTFDIVYNDPTLAVHTGEVWEISIPRLSTESLFTSYGVTLSVPQSFGKEAYISPNYKSLDSNNGYNNYSFVKEDISRTGITAGFGQFQVFSFTLNYHLENPLSKEALTEIALPPDTAYQKMTYQTLNPQPENVAADDDGNWIALYKLKPRERVDVKAMGFVQIFTSAREFPKPSPETLAANLKESNYWQVSASAIIEKAKSLKTPKEIYNFVSTYLSYDKERVKPNLERLGALSALENPRNAICMEYTDLFIAIARAAGIPAREINGYAYTENPEVEPLSLVADVLHSWPEYYDAQKGAWIPVDPTWGSTTGGVDFFTKLDLRHFAFVIHGRDSQKPYPAGSYKLGANPQKDVFVSFGQLPHTTLPEIKIMGTTSAKIPLFRNTINISLQNPGPGALYNLIPTISFDDKVVKTESLNVVPPYGKVDIEVNIPFSLLGINTPREIEVQVAGKKEVFPTFKNMVILYNLIAIFSVFFTTLVFVLIKTKKINFGGIIAKFKRHDTHNKEIDENSPPPMVA